ncbi:MAG: hypothetical protein ACTSUF_03435 [Candidatus Heimdallarchaeaceae archaeon]
MQQFGAGGRFRAPPIGGSGRMGGFGLGPGGNCVCPSCGFTTPHTTATPCYQMTCPKCGTRMTRR